jgi:predicted esterase
VAFLSVSATYARGAQSFVWSEDVALDTKQVKVALENVKDRLTVKPGVVIALGFSQGAQLVIEISVRDPELFAGAIALCPGYKN